MITLGNWGSSLALRLPSTIVEQAKLRPGLTVTCRLLDDGTIRVKLAGAAAQKRARAGEGEGTEAELPPEVPKQW
jgi:antitoxin component of MazEF toxin-antitoxin module